MANEQSIDQAFLSKLETIIERNLKNDQFGVDQLAHEAGMSRSKIHRKLKKLIGKSTTQFIREYRLQKALQLLKNQVGTISEIAYRVGFNSPTYFSKSFNDYYGFSPTEAIEKGTLSSSADTSEKKYTAVPTFRFKPFIYGLGILIILISITGLYLYRSSGQNINYAPASIAVLPLQNLTGDPGQQKMVDGLHDALIGKLGGIGKLQIISRTSTLPFESKPISLQEVAQELQVKNLMEGSVFQVGDSLRIQLNLIRIFPEEKHIWSASYNRSVEDILSLFNEITIQVAQNVEVALTKEEEKRLNIHPKVDPLAYRNYVIANNLIKSRHPNDIEEAIDLYEKSIELDPYFPDAYGKLAYSIGLMNEHGSLDLEEAVALMQRNIDKAFQLDPENGLAYLALSYLESKKNVSLDNPIKYATKASELLPNNALALFDLSEYLWLGYNLPKAQKVLQKAYSIDPLDPWISTRYAQRFFVYNKQYETALDLYNQIIEAHPNFAYAYIQKAFLIGNAPFGRIDSAFITLHKAWEATPESPNILTPLSYYGVNLDWPEWSEYITTIAQSSYPENIAGLRLPIINAMRFYQFQKLDSLYQVVDEEFGSPLKLLPYFYINLQYHRGNHDQALDLLLELDPEVIFPDSVKSYEVNPLFYYSKLLKTRSETEHLGTLYQEWACEKASTNLSRQDTTANEFFLKLNYAMCTSMRGEYKKTAEIFNEIYFQDKSKVSLSFYPKGMTYFDGFYKSNEYRSFRLKMNKDIQRMRSSIIEYLKKTGNWQEEWTPNNKLTTLQPYSTN